MAQPAPLNDNPYVGPRTFTQAQRHLFFGREREARDLLARVLSERLVLFYAQSGAGKSSLINTRLIPQLREVGYAVLPVARVSGELPATVPAVDNIYLFNLMLSLDQSEGDPQRFAHLTLSNFLAGLSSEDGHTYAYVNPDHTVSTPAGDQASSAMPYVMVIDQFEEIIMTHLGRWQDRAEFFRQLNQAMVDDPSLWVVLALREDYVAPIEPYAPLMADRMRARFYMERMGVEAALEAVQRPAELGGRPFAPGVAEKLVENLGMVRAAGEGVTVAGQYVEPVQLQVVCHQLWENIKNAPPGPITEADLAAAGDVDRALAQFYERVLADASRRARVPEIELRRFFQEQLITEQGTRGLVFRGAITTGKLPNEAVEILDEDWLIRRTERAGGTWYELVHDSFINPIVESNQAWRQSQPLLPVAQAWLNANKDASLLLRDDQLKNVLSTSDWQALGPTVREFVETSQSAQAERDRAQLEIEAREARRLRRLTVALAIALASALVFGLIAVSSALQAARARDVAVQRGRQLEERSIQLDEQRRRSRTDFAHQLAFRALADIQYRPQQKLLVATEAERIAKEERSVDAAITEVLSRTLAATGGIPWVPLTGQVLDAVAGEQVALVGLQDRSGSEAGRVLQIDLTRPDLPQELYSHPAPIRELAISDDARAVALQDATGALFLLRPLDPATPPARLNPGLQADWDLQFSADGSRLVAASPAGDLVIWPVEDPQPVTGVISPSAQTTLGQNGELLVASDGAQQLFLRNATALSSTARLHTLEEPAPVTALAYSDVAGLLAAGANNGVIGLWSRDPTWAEAWRDELQGPTAAVTALAFDPDGVAVAAGDAAGAVWLWPDTFGAAALPLRGHDRRVVSVRFSPDKRWLVSVDEAGEMRLWPLTPQLGLAHLDPTTTPCSDDPFTALTCVTAGRNLAEGEEWNAAVGPSEPYHVTCPALDQSFACVWREMIKLQNPQE